MLAVITFSVVNPLQLMAIPLALLLVALPPRRPAYLLLALALGALVFAGPRGTLWLVERGWSLLLGGWFVLAVVVWPRGSATDRAVAATLASVASAAAIIAVRGGWEVLDHDVAAHYADMAAVLSRTWPGGAVDAERVLTWTGEVPALVFPALTAVGSVAALAVAWWAFGRMSGRPHPLGRLTGFRFPDWLVWILIIGLALMLAPLSWGFRVGTNLVVFMGALYALRGLAVVSVLVLGMVGSRVGVLVALAVVGLILYPIVVAGMLLLGVTDTWLDLRTGRRTVNDGG